MKALLPEMEDLTAHQKKAVEALHRSQKGRLLVGRTPELMVQNFREVNKLRETNPEKAEENEKEIFADCGYTPE